MASAPGEARTFWNIAVEPRLQGGQGNFFAASKELVERKHSEHIGPKWLIRERMPTINCELLARGA
eukprot:2657800-Pyramimonas_sp.AAC.1